MRILSIVLNSVTYDSRVLKENASFLRHGHTAEIFGCHTEGLAQEETIQGIPVRRFRADVFNQFIGRSVLQYFGYLSLLWRLVRAYDGQDVIHANDLYVLPIAICIKWFRNPSLRIVYDAHEYETEMEHLNRVSKTFYRVLERFCIRRVDRVLTVSDLIAQEYQRLYGIEKPALVLNCPRHIPLERHDIFREIFPIDKQVTIYLFQGQIMPKRYLETLLELFTTQDASKRVIIFMGNPLIVLEERTALLHTIHQYAKTYNSIFYHPAVPPDQLMRYTSSADFGIGLFDNSSLSVDYTLPNKVFEYCMAGIPFLCNHTRALTQLLAQHPIGVFCDQPSVKGIEAAMGELERRGADSFAPAIAAAREIFSWEQQESTLLGIYQSLSESRKT